MRRALFLIMVSVLLLFFQSLNAQTWDPSKRVTWSPNQTYWPAIATDSINNIYIVRSDGDPNSLNEDLYLNKSTDGGTHWFPKRITWTSSGSQHTAIAIDSSDNIHVVYYYFAIKEIYYKRSTDGGNSWPLTKRLSWSPGGSRYPVITVDSSDNIHVAWSDNTYGSYEIFYRNSTDGGTTWQGLVRLPSSSSGPESPFITTDPSDNIHVVFADDSKGNKEIFYSRSTDGGNTWPLKKRLTWTSGRSLAPSIAADSSNNIHVVWGDATSMYSQIYYRKSTDGGDSWQGAEKRTWTSSDSSRPVIAADSSDNIHLIWQRELIPFSDKYEIFYKRNLNGTTSWPATRLTWSGRAIWPDIVIDSGNTIHVTWWDNAFGNYEIYYRKGTQ